MDEAPCFIDMYYDITRDFIGNKHFNKQTLGNEKQGLSLILAIFGDDIKILTLIIIKGEEGKTTEKQMQDLYYAKNKEIFTHFQQKGWHTTELF